MAMYSRSSKQNTSNWKFWIRRNKFNTLLNSIKEQDSDILTAIDKIYLYAKDLNVYNNIKNYNPKRKQKILIAFDDMIADIKTNKKFQSIAKELFIKSRKLNMSLVFVLFSCSKRIQIKFHT